MLDTVVYIIEIIGIVSFAIAGALVAIDKETDWFGVLFLAVITTFGGGIMRDLFLGRTPPAFFVSMPDYVVVCIATALIVFILAYIFKGWYVKNEELMKRVNNFFDAAGIAAFTVNGVRIAMEFCPEGGAFLAILMGMITSIGGGMTRDIILRDIPFVLCKHIYALATLAGGALYYVLSVYAFAGSEIGEVIAQVSGMITVFLIRVFATVFRWNMPKAIDFSKMKNGSEADAEEKTEEKIG